MDVLYRPKSLPISSSGIFKDSYVRIEYGTITLVVVCVGLYSNQGGLTEQLQKVGQQFRIVGPIMVLTVLVDTNWICRVN